mmetsp:Transcript_24756/g.53970  ORF Transcript_24756/g.53970 Transcript_24756/m.53970 type:complete len:204 (-) Transcript_24756:1423-2034(-)
MDGVLSEKAITGNFLELSAKTNDVGREGLGRRRKRTRRGGIIAVCLPIPFLVLLLASSLGRCSRHSDWLGRLDVLFAKLDVILWVTLVLRFGRLTDNTKHTKLVGAHAVDVVFLPKAILLHELDFDTRFGNDLAPLLPLSLGGHVNVGQAERAMELAILRKLGRVLLRPEVADQLEPLSGKGVGVLVVPHPLQLVLALLEVVR